MYNSLRRLVIFGAVLQLTHTYVMNRKGKKGYKLKIEQRIENRCGLKWAYFFTMIPIFL